MIDPTDATMLTKLKDAFSSLVMFGMTQQMQVDMKAVATAIVIGGVSAVGGSYLTSRDNARELAAYAKAQEEFRIEMRQYMREQTIEVRSLADRVTRQEIMASAIYAPNGGLGIDGMNGNGRRK